MVVDSFLHEPVYFFGDFLSSIKKCLLFIILPVECEVHDADGLPKVAELRTGAIDYSGYFVSDYEFQILPINRDNSGDKPRAELEKMKAKWS